MKNTCYASAVLQILFKIIPPKFKDRGGDIIRLFFELKEEVNSDNYWKLIKTAVKKIAMVDDEEQQDAQEFLMEFIKLLNDEVVEEEEKRRAEKVGEEL